MRRMDLTVQGNEAMRRAVPADAVPADVVLVS
jgi:hypothetical protein